MRVSVPLCTYIYALYSLIDHVIFLAAAMGFVGIRSVSVEIVLGWWV